jgi:hypothetical protein
MARERRAPLYTASVFAPLLVLSSCDTEAATAELDIDALPLLVAEEEMRIGDVDDPYAGFSQPFGVTVDRDGRIYVLEATERQIRVYDEGGRILRRIGGPGEGPGEFAGVPRFGVVGDTVWAWDTRANRITLFDREGTLLSTGRTDGVQVALWGSTSYGYVLPTEMRADGLFTGSLSRVSFNRNSPPTGVQPTDSVPVPKVLFDASGAVVDTIGWEPSPPPRMARPPSLESAYQTLDVGGRRMGVPRPPTTLPYWVALHDGRIVLDVPEATDPSGGIFTLTRHGTSGDTVYHRELQYRPVPYSSAELDSIAARAARGAPGGGVGYVPGAESVPDNYDVIRLALRGAMDFPPYRQPISYAEVGNDHSVWLFRDDFESDVDRWIVLDPDGTPRGELGLPASTRLYWMEGDRVWAVVPGEFDVPWLVRYRIRPG